MDEEDLRERGVPEAVLPYAYWNPDPKLQDEFIPIVHLPDGWSRAGEPSVGALREAVELGIGLSPAGELEEPFDLEWLGESLSSVRLLWCSPVSADIRNLGLVTRMSSLVSFLSPISDDVFDLSGLTQLQVVRIKGLGFLSALRAPALSHAFVEVPSLDSEAILSPSIETLHVRAHDVDTRFTWSGRPRLRRLLLEGGGSVDLTGVDRLPELEVLSVFDFARVTGVASLAQAPRLREVTLSQLRAIDAPESLLNLRSEHMRAEYCRDLDEEYALAAKQRSSNWEIVPAKKPKASGRFRVSKAIDGSYEVTFDDWEWLQSTAAPDFLERVATSSELGDTLRRAAAESGSTRSISYQVDSEGDAFIAVTTSRSDAYKLKRVWDEHLRREAETMK